jgi:hypothetical protein
MPVGFALTGNFARASSTVEFSFAVVLSMVKWMQRKNYEKYSESHNDSRTSYTNFVSLENVAVRTMPPGMKNA